MRHDLDAQTYTIIIIMHSCVNLCQLLKLFVADVRLPRTHSYEMHIVMRILLVAFSHC